MATKGSKRQAAAPGIEFTVGEGVKVVDDGAYSARIAWVIVLGLQESMMQKAPRRQFLIGFEVQGATCDGADFEERPVLSRRYSMSWGEKADLPKLIRAVNGADPRPGETVRPAEWVGKPVTLIVEHKAREGGGVSARITSVTRNASKLPELDVEPVIYPGKTSREQLPEWVRAILDQQLESAAPVKKKAKAKKAKPVEPPLPPEAGDLDSLDDAAEQA